MTERTQQLKLWPMKNTEKEEKMLTNTKVFFINFLKENFNFKFIYIVRILLRLMPVKYYLIKYLFSNFDYNLHFVQILLIFI